MLQPTTKHSHFAPVRDIQAGHYFKYQSRWHLAISDAQSATGDWARLYAWMIRAYNTDGTDLWVGIYDQPSRETVMVEVSKAAKRPGPFAPATLRRKARVHQEEAQRQLYAAHVKETLARRLENGTIPG